VRIVQETKDKEGWNKYIVLIKELLIIFVCTKSQEVAYEGSHLSVVECLTY
jgi:hypothetical protein